MLKKFGFLPLAAVLLVLPVLFVSPVHAASGPAITLLTGNGDSDSSGPIGSNLPVVALVEDSSGNPINGLTVNFNITSGPNAGLTDSAASSPSSGPGYLCAPGRLQGVAEFYYKGTQTGTDVIQASAVVNGTTLTTSTSFDWFNPASNITLTAQTIAPGQNTTAIVNGFAGTWIGFPDYHNCAPNEHQTTITLSDSLGNSLSNYIAPNPCDGAQDCPGPITVAVGPNPQHCAPNQAQIELSTPGTSNNPSCLAYGTITLTVITPDIVNRVIAPPGSGVDLAYGSGFGHYATITFQLVSQSSTGVPEFPSPIGFSMVLVFATIALALMRRRILNV
jgi:hypothetical protein